MMMVMMMTMMMMMMTMMMAGTHFNHPSLYICCVSCIVTAMRSVPNRACGGMAGFDQVTPNPGRVQLHPFNRPVGNI